MKAEIVKRFSGQCCTIDDINRFVGSLSTKHSRNTVIWNVNDLVKQGRAIRVGRGVYEFTQKPKLQPAISESARVVCAVLNDGFKYLEFTITDSYILSQFMNLQPFSTVVVVETRKSAADAVLSTLRKKGVEAYAKKDFAQLERYISSRQPFVIRPELTVNPTLQNVDNIRIANIEKILVDIACDENIYGQYQGDELKNIYHNATEKYAINYSQMLKYAAARKKKPLILDILQQTSEYRKVETLL